MKLVYFVFLTCAFTRNHRCQDVCVFMRTYSRTSMHVQLNEIHNL